MNRVALSLVLSVFVGSPLAALPEKAPVEATARFGAADLSQLARSLPAAAELRLEGVPLAAGGPAATLELERFEVFTRDAEIWIDGAASDRRPPASARFRGRIAGDPTSTVLLTFRPGGAYRGLIVGAGGPWVLEGGPGFQAAGGAAARRVLGEFELPGGEAGFACEQGELTALEREALPRELLGASLPGPAPDDQATAAGLFTHTARVAIETDREFFGLFGNVDDALDYVGDLFAFASIVYEDEIETSLLVPAVSLWTGATDPWVQNGAFCGMMELGEYWNANHTDVDRTLVHFMSGRGARSGIAWVGVLCNGAFNVNVGASCPGMAAIGPYGGDYGFTGGIDGTFSIASPQVIWDVVAVMHEIGHNFNSPHTHCYNGLGGNGQPVDECSNIEAGEGCYAGVQRLPCASVGAGCGTLMSYCHLLSGGFGNIEMTFGQDHPFGVEPDRVPDRMRSHVLSVAGSNAACLAPQVSDLIFSDGFESGDLSAWSAVVP